MRSEKSQQDAGGRGFDSRHLHDVSVPVTWVFAQVGTERDTNLTREEEQPP